eukprot:190638_1
MGASFPTIILPAADPLFDYFLFIGRSKYVGEEINMPLNVILLILFCYLDKKRRADSKIKAQKSTIILTYFLLIFGVLFSISQAIFENIYLKNCANFINTCIEFFFYIGHRMFLLLIFLSRLQSVFKNTTFAYPNYIYYILLIFITVSSIASFFAYIYNLQILKIDSGWKVGNGETYVCLWKFSQFVVYCARPVDYALNVSILLMFLYKLYKLHRSNKTLISSATAIDNADSNKLEISARRVTILTAVAVTSSIIVTGGYITPQIRAIGAFWPYDLTLNSLCCIWMFSFTKFMIDPCFGKQCDRCCCIKYLVCFHEPNQNIDEEIQSNRTEKTKIEQSQTIELGSHNTSSVTSPKYDHHGSQTQARICKIVTNETDDSVKQRCCSSFIL